MTRASEVVVIGGGIAGCATAYFLARKGVPVTVCAKQRIGGEQSSRSRGFVRQQGRASADLAPLRFSRFTDGTMHPPYNPA